MNIFVSGTLSACPISRLINLLLLRPDVNIVHVDENGQIPKPTDGGLLIESPGVLIDETLRQFDNDNPKPITIVALCDDTSSKGVPSWIRTCSADRNEEHLAAELLAMMDLHHCNIGRELERLLHPFASATMETLMTFCGATSKLTAAGSKTDCRMSGDVSGLIVLYAKEERVLAISFPRDAANKVAACTMGIPAEDLDLDAVLDCIGELAGIIAGQAKGRFVDTEFEFDIATPSVICGKDHEILFHRDLPAYVLQFESEMGAFSLQLCVPPSELKNNQYTMEESNESTSL